MSIITIIAAIANNNALGKDNDLIWHLPADLKRFKKVTSGHHILMGRNTYESIGKPLPNRTTVIITRNPNYQAVGCIVVDSIEKAVEIAKDDSEIFIIGGAFLLKVNIGKNRHFCQGNGLLHLVPQILFYIIIVSQISMLFMKI